MLAQVTAGGKRKIMVITSQEKSAQKIRLTKRLIMIWHRMIAFAGIILGTIWDVHKFYVGTVFQVKSVNPFVVVPTNNYQHIKNRRRALLSAASTSNAAATQKIRVVVIGGGWAGFSVADSLSYAADGVQVTLLDASPRGPGGLAGGWKSPLTNRTVEAGLHGFWREYRNTRATLERILSDHQQDILTPYTPSVLYSATGRVALAPVLGSNNNNNHNHQPNHKTNLKAKDVPPTQPPSQDIWNVLTASVRATTSGDAQQQRDLLQTVADLLPPPLDVAVRSEFTPDSKLTVADRLFAVRLVPIWADFDPQDDVSWKRYDSISAETLFRVVAGVSETLYTELVSPLLHVLPMCPGYDCSAAAALSCFHVFALQARGAFDVQWCRGSLSAKLFNPWVQKLTARDVRIQGGATVTSITEADQTLKVTVNGNQTIVCDAVVLAVGITAAQKLLRVSPPLAALPETAQWNRLRGVTCVCVRLFFENRLPAPISHAMKDSPVAVCGARIGGIPELAETGFCIYDLQRLQDEFKNSTSIAALEVDFYRGDAILRTCFTDDEVARLTLRAVSAALQIDPIDPTIVVDVSVVRARKAVSHFSVGSTSCTPTSVRLRRQRLYICGDWVDRTGHASWSTEKSVVTGRQAAAAVAADWNLILPPEATSIISAAHDTPQLTAARKIAKWIRSLPGQKQGLPRTPWL